MSLNDFFIFGDLPANRIIGQYNQALVALSYLIATLATYVAIEFSLQLQRELSKTMQLFWHVGGSVAMGSGIWAMHFTGMLAYDMNMEHSYSVGLTLLSLFIPIAISAVVLDMMRLDSSLRTILVTAPFLGGGIALMHYLGMEAMEMRASLHYLPGWFAISIAIAVGASGAALCIISRVTKISGTHGYCVKLAAAMIMAVAICGMHYSGMQATVIIPFADCRFGEGDSEHKMLLAFGIGSLVIMILGIAITAIIINQKFLSNLKSEVTARISDVQKKQILLDTIVENIPLSLFAKDVKNDYRWVIWNRKAQEVFGLTPEQVLGKVDYDLFPKAEADFFRATDIAVIQGGKVIDIPEEPVTTKRGTWPAHTIKVPVYDEKCNPSILMGILEDISAQKAREKELEDARNSAVSANKLKSEFLSNISHELRTPMHSIITFSRQGMERINQWTPEEHKENLQLIHSSGSRLLILLNDLLDLSKLESGTVKYDIRKSDLSPLIRNAINSLRSLADEKKISIEYLNESVSSVVECDAQKIVQVIVNLLSNALKFSQSGQRIEMQTAPSEEMGGSVLITVADQGVGVPEGELEHIFDKFIQSSKTKTGAGGTGLGLAICKEIVLSHGGKIWGENRTGGGTLFSVLLPVAYQQEQDNG